MLPSYVKFPCHKVTQHREFPFLLFNEAIHTNERKLSWYLVRSFVCNTKRPSVKQSVKWQVSSNFQIYPGKTDDYSPPLPSPPSPFKTARAQSELFAFQCGQWEPIRNSQLIGRYKEMSVWHQVNLMIYPPLPSLPIRNCHSSEWALCFSMQSMWAHSKQSTNRKI